MHRISERSASRIIAPRDRLLRMTQLLILICCMIVFVLVRHLGSGGRRRHWSVCCRWVVRGESTRGDGSGRLESVRGRDRAGRSPPSFGTGRQVSRYDRVQIMMRMTTSCDPLAKQKVSLNARAERGRATNRMSECFLCCESLFRIYDDQGTNKVFGCEYESVSRAQ